MATINLKRIDDDYQFVTTDETGQHRDTPHGTVNPHRTQEDRSHRT